MAPKGVARLNEQYKDARSDYAAQEQRLGADLAAFGPALTEQQRNDYIEAFWNDPDHKPAKDALESTAAAGDSDSAKVLLDSL